MLTQLTVVDGTTQYVVKSWANSLRFMAEEDIFLLCHCTQSGAHPPSYKIDNVDNLSMGKEARALI